MPSTPNSLEEVTTEWLTHILRNCGAISKATVTAMDSRILGQDIGFLSVVARLGLTYDIAEPDAPSSVVIKLETRHEELQKFSQDLQAFQREIRFYQEVAPRVDVRLPKIFYTVAEPPSLMLVMEDLSYCRAGDQVKGMTAESVMATAALIGRLQAKFWNNDALDSLDWMPATNHLDRDFAEKWPSMETHFGKWIGEDGLAVGRRMVEHMAWISNEIRCRPRTVTHNDLREDNLLFDESGAVTEVIILDWQLATRSMGVFDVARLMGGSALPDLRRGHEVEILRAWYGALVAEGVTDYHWEEALYDLRLGILQLISFITHFHPAFINNTGRSAQLTEAIIRRTFATAVDLQAGVAMPA